MDGSNSVTPDPNVNSRMTDSSRGRRPLPPDDLDLFAGLLPHEIPAVAESRVQAYRTIIEDISGYIVQLNAIHNAAIPLHATLPPEVLTNVFRHILPICASDLRLTHVCKLWRDLIHGTPEFWADMLAADAVSSRLSHYDTDSQAPLSLMTFIVRSSPLSFKLDVREELNFLATIPSHMSRIYSLSWTIPVDYDYNHNHHSCISSFDVPMPLLEQMQCSANSIRERWALDEERIMHYRPHYENFPRLRTLSLCGLGLASRAFAAFPSLRQLNIDDGSFPAVHSLSCLLDLLKNCPQLQVLVLNIGSPSSHTFPESDAFSLSPHLTAFSLTFRTPAPMWAYRFLQCVSVPRTTRLKITWLAGTGTHSLTWRNPTFPPDSIEAVQIAHALTIRFKHDQKGRAPSNWTLQVEGFVPSSPQPRLELTYNPSWKIEGDRRPSSALSGLMAQFESHTPSLTDFNLRLDPGITVTPGDWVSILNSLSSLSSVSSLTVHIDSCRNLLDVLRRHTNIFPALRKLSISCQNGSGVHESLLSAVEQRARQGLSLEYLAFSGSREKPLSEHRVRRLQELVGEMTMADYLEL